MAVAGGLLVGGDCGRCVGAPPHRDLVRGAGVVGGRRFTGSARVLTAGDEDALARRLVYEKYREGEDLEEWRDTALPVAIDLDA